MKGFDGGRIICGGITSGRIISGGGFLGVEKHNALDDGMCLSDGSHCERPDGGRFISPF